MKKMFDYKNLISNKILIKGFGLSIILIIIPLIIAYNTSFLHSIDSGKQPFIYINFILGISFIITLILLLKLLWTILAVIITACKIFIDNHNK